MKEHQVLLVIDMQNEGLLNRDVFNKYGLINNVNSIIDFFHKNKKPVFFIQHSNKSFLKANTDGWKIYEALHLSKEDKIVNKRNINVFREQHFLSLLEEYRIEEAIITGLVSNGCINAACLGGLDMGISVTLISDGHSTFCKNAEKVVSKYNLQLEKQGVRVIPALKWLRIQL